MPDTHMIKNGETLSGIAAYYKVPTDALASTNGIKDVNRIRAGQAITIPDWPPKPFVPPQPPQEPAKPVKVIGTTDKPPSEPIPVQIVSPDDVNVTTVAKTPAPSPVDNGMKKVQDFFAWAHENMAPDHVMGMANMLGLAVGATPLGEALAAGGHIPMPTPMAGASRAVAEARGSQGAIDPNSPIQPTEAQMRRLAQAIKKRPAGWDPGLDPEFHGITPDIPSPEGITPEQYDGPMIEEGKPHAVGGDVVNFPGIKYSPEHQKAAKALAKLGFQVHPNEMKAFVDNPNWKDFIQIPYPAKGITQQQRNLIKIVEDWNKSK